MVPLNFTEELHLKISLTHLFELQHYKEVLKTRPPPVHTA